MAMVGGVRLLLVRGERSWKKLSVVYERESFHFILYYLIWSLFSVGVVPEMYGALGPLLLLKNVKELIGSSVE